MNPLHYPSLELCKKLTEAGFPITEYCWSIGGTLIFQTIGNVRPDTICPSVMELLDEMPTYDLTFMDDAHWVIRHTSDHAECGTLPNALAEMWLWLKENGYLSIK